MGQVADGGSKDRNVYKAFARLYEEEAAKHGI